MVYYGTEFKGIQVEASGERETQSKYRHKRTCGVRIISILWDCFIFVKKKFICHVN